MIEIRIIDVGGQEYNFSKMLVCECSQDKSTDDRHSNATFMIHNINKDQYECFWCGKIFKNNTFQKPVREE